MKITHIISIIILIFLFGIGIYFYGAMPDLMATHWNSNGEVDGYMTKFWGLFLLPSISFIIYLFLVIIPIIDPLKENIEKFRIYFDNFILATLLFLSYIYLLTIYWNLGNTFDMNLMIFPAISILFYFYGIILCRAKRNWFIGIRTPWTLSSDIVWNKTHKFGGRLFKIMSFIILIGAFMGESAYLFVIIPVAITIVSLLVYSYVEYGNELIK